MAIILVVSLPFQRTESQKTETNNNQLINQSNY